MPLPRTRLVAFLIWAGLTSVMAVPVVIAATSPYLAYRNLPYLVGGFAGILCLSLFVIQPLLAAGYLPGLSHAKERKWHHWVGASIVVCVVLHVAGLYLASPPDILDALLLVAPTPFSVYGVVAMWGTLATAILVGLRQRLRLRYPAWTLLHNALAVVVVAATVIHATQIEGAMEIVSKWVLCVAAVTATAVALLHLRVVKPLVQRRRSTSQATDVR
jgi:predicted ferric reductase